MTDAIEPASLDEESGREENEVAAKKSFRLLAPLQWVNISQLVDEEALQQAIDATPAGTERVVSFAIRVAPRAGGYLFQFRLERSSFVLLTYRSRSAHRFTSLTDLASFINHCTGMKYSKRQQDIVQLINVQTELVEEIAEAIE